MNYNKWLSHRFVNGTNSSEDYRKFESEMRADLGRQAASNGLRIHRFNSGHYEFSAILKSAYTGESVYVSIPDVRYSRNQWYNHVLYCPMVSAHSWMGGTNHYCRWTDVGRLASGLALRKRA